MFASLTQPFRGASPFLANKLNQSNKILIYTYGFIALKIYRLTSEFRAGAIKKTILSNIMTEKLSKSL